jgi:hypothetical protein
VVWWVFVAAILSEFGDNVSTAANICSSLDGQKYCSCEYNQRCNSTENSCNCAFYDPQAPAPVLRSQPPENPDHGTPASSAHGQRQEPTINHDLKPLAPVDDSRPGAPEGARLEAPRSPIKPAPKSEDARTARDYVQLAQTAITKGNAAEAVELIEKGQTRLLDRSVDLNRTFDPITDEPVQSLSAAKRALLSRDRVGALRALDAALTAMK